MRPIELEGIDNVRDFGGVSTINGRMLPHGIFYRGSAPCSITAKDADTLLNTLGITCMVDFRTSWERESKPTDIHQSCEVFHIPFYDKETLGLEYTQPGLEGKVIGRDVPCIPEMYYASLSHPIVVNQIRKCIETVFSKADIDHPIYIHCSGGKDRTGIIAALVLHILGAHDSDILTDYMYTNIARDAKYESELAKYIKFAKGDEAEAKKLCAAHRARTECLIVFRDSMCETFGTFDNFLETGLGITPVVRQSLIDRFTVRKTEPELAACAC